MVIFYIMYGLVFKFINMYIVNMCYMFYGRLKSWNIFNLYIYYLYLYFINVYYEKNKFYIFEMKVV